MRGSEGETGRDFDGQRGSWSYSVLFWLRTEGRCYSRSREKCQKNGFLGKHDIRSGTVFINPGPCRFVSNLSLPEDCLASALSSSAPAHTRKSTLITSMDRNKTTV